MRKLLLFLFILLAACSSDTSYKKSSRPQYRCTGSEDCTACKTCSGCRHCSQDGGVCGVCDDRNRREDDNDQQPQRKRNANKPSRKSKTNAAQCAAITKKGTQCSRRASDNGYCWQHGK